MAKKKSVFGTLLGLAFAAGAAAVGYSLYKQYKEEQEELANDFHEFEDDDFDLDDDDFVEEEESLMTRYPQLEEDKNEFVGAARDALDAAKTMISTGVELAKTASKVLSENTTDVRGKAAEAYSGTADKMAQVYADGANKAADIIEVAKGKVHEVQNMLDEKINELKAEEAKAEVSKAEVNLDNIDGDVTVAIEEDD